MFRPAATADIDQVLQLHNGKILGYLIRLCGNFDDAEDITQDVMLAALTHWRDRGIPEHPSAWLFTTAKNRATDRFRATGVHNRVHGLLAVDPTDSADLLDKALEDDLLRLIFTCCHPAISDDARVPLTLKSITGLSLEEVARAFLVSPRAMEQRLVRAKRKIQSAGIAYEIPAGPELEPRIASVMQSIYLLFNEGYSATSGDDLIRRDLCREAIRLATLMQRLFPGRAELMSLLALLWFQDSRSDARVTDGGELILLGDQDRSKWDSRQIQQGVALLDKALHLRQPPGPYQLQASIAALHAQAANAGQTDWQQIVLLYAKLLEMNYTEVLHLNYSVAMAMAGNVQRALDEINTLQDSLDNYFPFHCARAEFHTRLGNDAAGRTEFERALTMTDNRRERESVLQRLQQLEA